MPINVKFHPAQPALGDDFARVLGDQPAYVRALSSALKQGRGVFAAHFNGKPVAVALTDQDALDWMVVHPATRGRGVGRDFLRLLEKHHDGALILPEKCRR